MFGVTAFSAIMIIGGVIGLLFFARPTTSAVEMRNLTTFPEFTMSSFLDGSFFTDVSLWYADTYPLREPMVAADHAVDSLFGVNTGTGMVGGNVKADEIPVESGKNGNSNAGGSEEGSGSKKEEFVPVEPTEAPDEHAVDADIQANIMSGVYIKDGAGYGVYYFSQNAADTYITAMNTAAEKLDGTSTVYSIMVPANSICLPDNEANAVGGSDQQQTLEYLKSRFDSRVKQVNLIDTLKEHRDEYTYFHTDHHWTQLGAYYGYVELCKAKGIEPKKLSDWKEVDLGALEGSYMDTLRSMGFTGSDDVEAYIPSSTNEMTFWTSDGQEVEGSVIDEAATDWEPSYKYMAFISGDRPLTIIKNPKLDDGSSCLVVKDSYGCTFVPCLVDNYETVHVIDFRETDKNICDYAKENDIKDVIFLTNIKIGLTDTVAQTLLSEVS